MEQPAGAEPRAKIVSVVGAQRNVMAPNTIRLMAAATPVEPTRPSGTIHVEKRDLLPGTPAPQPAK